MPSKFPNSLQHETLAHPSLKGVEGFTLRYSATFRKKKSSSYRNEIDKSLSEGFILRTYT